MIDILDQRWSDHDTANGWKDTIALQVEQQVAAVPDKLAIVTDEISLTYRELDVKASRIAAVLASLSSRRDQPVGTLIKDDAARIAAVLGALKANRIFIPIAPNSPAKWITQVIEDSGTAQIIVDSSTRSVAELATTGNITVMEVKELVRSPEPFVASRTVSADDTAYIVYTSGSTGRPKGVAISHRSSIRRNFVCYAAMGFGRNERSAILASSGLSTGINEIVLALISGGCLFPFDLRRHGLQKLAPWLIAQEISCVSFLSSLLRTWLASLPDDLRFPALCFVDVWGERLYAEDVIQVSRHLEGDWRIGHSYSSTECGTITSPVFTPSHLPGADIVAGGPVDGMEVRIQDETGALVPPGEIGEIVIRSRFLAQGYWNTPDLTAKVFQTDPLDSAIRIYHTGDLGRWRSDGALEHLGRKGRRIRLHGYNVEPFQVECELMRHPDVTDAVVLLHEGSAGEEPCLVGYVVASPNTSPSAMRKGLAGRLPSYMVPSHIVVLDTFPVGSSGKIDHNALPPPDREPARPVAFRTPADEREHELCEIWQEVLKFPKIGIDDDFFALGGSSMQALMMFAKIEARLGCSLSPTTIVQAPTIARLAEFIRTTTGVTRSQSLVAFRSSGTGLPLFLVHGRSWQHFYYRHLLSDLKSDRPVFGLQPPPLNGKHRIARTLESMAADYVTEIQRVQPHGPYFLAGHSFGGRMSFEIAQRLVGLGERVSFLGLIDTGVPDTSTWASEVVRLSHKARDTHGFQDLLVRGINFMKFKISHSLSITKAELLFRKYDRWLEQGRSIPYERRTDYYARLCDWANRDYVPKPYPGHITILSSAGNSERQRENWTPIACGGLTILEVPAGHSDMLLPPHSKLLAEYFDSCLDAAMREMPKSPEDANAH